MLVVAGVYEGIALGTIELHAVGFNEGGNIIDFLQL